MTKSFVGGIHPPYNKELTMDKPVVTMPLPKKVRLLFNQQIGAPCKPLVQKGDVVSVGQKIADADDYVSVPIIASVAGEVTKVDEEGVEIATDADNSQLPKQPKSYQSVDELRQIIREAGIVGLGGAAFPTHVKVTPPKDKPIDTLILNGAECEPYLTTDYSIMVEKGKRVVRGAELLMEACGAHKTIIGIEKNKPQAISVLKELTAEKENFQVVAVPVIYPQGGERQLIQTLTGKEVPVGGLPMDVGIVVNNVVTAAAVYYAVDLGQPLIERLITVSGSGVVEPTKVIARVGTSIKEILEFCGGLTEDVAKVVNGGPMMGKALTDIDVPTVKGTAGILAFSEAEVRIYEEKACISCARCVDVCPQKLLPNYLAQYSRKAKYDDAEDIHLFNCIECGCCSYVCPSRIPIVHHIQVAKTQINAQGN